MLNPYIKIQLINSPLTFRRRLTIPVETRFGLEIELESVDLDKVYHLVKTQFGSSWIVKDDKSLLKNHNAEIATPVLNNSISTWELLKKLSELISRLKPTFDNCSFQINFDGSLLPTVDDKVNLLKIFAYYGDIIYRFSKGEDEDYRSNISVYANPIILALKDVINDGNYCTIERFNNQRRYGINFKTEEDIIEFRSINGTKNIILWQNYITFFYYLIHLARTRKYNLREIDSYIDSYSQINMLEEYEKINEKKALSLSKKQFNNQTDRIYFLQQYIGNK